MSDAAKEIFKLIDVSVRYDKEKEKYYVQDDRVHTKSERNVGTLWSIKIYGETPEKALENYFLHLEKQYCFYVNWTDREQQRAYRVEDGEIVMIQDERIESLMGRRKWKEKQKRELFEKMRAFEVEASSLEEIEDWLKEQYNTPMYGTKPYEEILKLARELVG